MLTAFLALAARSPSRQRAFRRVVVVHLLVLAGALAALRLHASVEILGHSLLVAGIVEGAVLIGWRLTQLPKSQALEFLLVSPLRPRQLLVLEAAVGLLHLALTTLAGLPVLLLLIGDGYLEPLDLVPLLALPAAWGAAAGLGLTVWAYEPAWIRRWGEKVAIALVVAYLVVGVLAGEHLRTWLAVLPDELAQFLLAAFFRFHTDNPFGVMRFWLEVRHLELTASVQQAIAVGVGLTVVLLVRAACRLQAHFHELHYQPSGLKPRERRAAVGERPLTWWAVKRVTRFSGRVNLWLAGGFAVLYAAYLLAGDAWPAWLGRTVFVMCDQAGGVPALTTALVVLAAVPAAFQYGLWDSSVEDRSRRLELLLLTDLQPADYWHAAVRAAWDRGCGYLALAALLWLAAVGAGRLSWLQALAAGAGATILWGLYFTLGFRAFARGVSSGGIGMVLTLGLPLLAVTAYRLGWPLLGMLSPPGLIYGAASAPPGLALALGAVGAALLTLISARHSLARADHALRLWYARQGGARLLR